MQQCSMHPPSSHNPHYGDADQLSARGRQDHHWLSAVRRHPLVAAGRVCRPNDVADEAIGSYSGRLRRPFASYYLTTCARHVMVAVVIARRWA